MNIRILTKYNNVLLREWKENVLKKILGKSTGQKDHISLICFIWG